MTTIDDVLADYPLPDSDSARLDIELLLSFILECDRVYLRAWPEKSVSEAHLQRFLLLYLRRKQGEPIAHILGERAFWNLDLHVTPDTLIPRPDTEILIEHALSLDLPSSSKVLDLGTGTGAIALSLASERPNWQVLATDRFPDVLALAKKNAQLNDLDQVEFLCSAWFEKITETDFNLIVSNPPYIDASDPHLSVGDVRFEPVSALVAGNKGLSDIEEIIEGSKGYLISGGWLVLEHGYQQAEAVRLLFSESGYLHINTVQDYGGQDRVSYGQLISENFSA